MSYQGRERELILIPFSEGVNVPGLLFSDITVRIRKNGESTMSVKPLTTDDWLELLPGIYVLTFSEGDMNTLGTFFAYISGAEIDNITVVFEVIPYPVLPSISPSTCVISGNLYDLGGSPSPINSEIIFRPVKIPVANNSALVLGIPIRTLPNAYGSFSIALIRGMTVTVEIELAGIKAQFTVPDAASANLIDLLPVIP